MFGSHLSIAGGLHNALLEAERLGFLCVQIFTKNQQQWKARPLEQTQIDLWRSHCRRLGFTRTVSHDSYLNNLASPVDSLWRMSVEAFAEELRRCDLLGIAYLVTHPGAHMGSGEAAGLSRVAEGLERAYELAGHPAVTTCLESTAGQGTCLGWRMEHLADIRKRTAVRRRIGYCLDTAHLFAAGYDFRGRRFAGFLREVDRILGLSRLKVLHINDSKTPLGSRVDRHEHIGRGHIGPEGFRPLVRARELREIPKILETPKDKDAKGREWDAVNLAKLRAMMAR